VYENAGGRNKVLCLGKTTVDLIFAELEKFPQIGKEYAAKHFMIKPGGCANTPLALAKLGVPVVFVSSLGDDFLGAMALRSMESAGLDTRGIYCGDGVETNVTGVLSVGFDRGFASYFPTWKNEEVNRNFYKYLENCTHVHFSLKDCLEGGFLEAARARGRTVSIDATWDDHFTLARVKDCLRKCDIFFCNELELRLITNTPDIGDAVGVLKSVSDCFVLKLGAEGSVLYKSGSRMSAPTPQINGVCDTTGAGDAFAAGFLYGYLNDRSPEESLKLASASGTLATTFYGGSDERFRLERVVELAESIGIA
jgi:sugar/nucleoside kinase (ribokinase family)